MADFKVEGQEYTIPENLTLGELRLVKQITGRTLGELQGANLGDDPDTMVAFVFITMRREHPHMTLADVEEISVEDFDFVEAPAVTEATPEDDADVPPALLLDEPASIVETPASTDSETIPEPSGIQL